MPKVVHTFRLESKLFDRLQQAAAGRSMTVSELVRRLILDYLDKMQEEK